MEPKPKSEFFKKISINGFSIEEKDNLLILRPRGSELTAEITLEEAVPNIWKVVRATGRYAGFGRGAKRTYFESYINRWVVEALALQPALG